MELVGCFEERRSRPQGECGELVVSEVASMG